MNEHLLVIHSLSQTNAEGVSIVTLLLSITVWLTGRHYEEKSQMYIYKKSLP